MVRIPIVLDWTQTHERRQLVRKNHARKGGNFGIDSRRKNVGGSQTFINAQTTIFGLRMAFTSAVGVQ